MAKWAKSLNQKKDLAKASQVRDAPSISSTSSTSEASLSTKGSEDIAFSMMQKKLNPSAMSLSSSKNNSSGLAGLASYGSDSEDDSNAVSAAAAATDSSQLTDWSTLACLLCKRKFGTREKLEKSVIDSPGHGRLGGHYFHAWCTSVRPSQKQKRSTADTMCEDNDRLLAVAWWVILNSLNLFTSVFVWYNLLIFP